MGQVPKYLIVGNGKMAKHFGHYLATLNLSFQTWNRQHYSVETLKHFADDATHILLLISDHAIEPFIKRHPYIQNKTLVHCSGCLETPLAYSAHPLSTFGHQRGDTHRIRGNVKMCFSLKREHNF